MAAPFFRLDSHNIFKVMKLPEYKFNLPAQNQGFKDVSIRKQAWKYASSGCEIVFQISTEVQDSLISADSLNFSWTRKINQWVCVMRGSLKFGKNGKVWRILEESSSICNCIENEILMMYFFLSFSNVHFWKMMKFRCCQISGRSRFYTI